MRYEVVWRCTTPRGGLVSNTLAPSDPVYIEKITTRLIPDSGFDKATRTWTIPLTEIIVDFTLAADGVPEFLSRAMPPLAWEDSE